MNGTDAEIQSLNCERARVNLQSAAPSVDIQKKADQETLLEGGFLENGMPLYLESKQIGDWQDVLICSTDQTNGRPGACPMQESLVSGKKASERLSKELIEFVA